MLRELNRARILLASRGIWNDEMTMVLFAMFTEKVGYEAAVSSYAEFTGRSTAQLVRAMEAAAGAAGRREGARHILEDCYAEGIGCV